jgi:hypothetical protein
MGHQRAHYRQISLLVQIDYRAIRKHKKRINFNNLHRQ